jgi:O-antigen/teichoic acid export membrane protein
MRAMAITTLDQALLSALNLGIALVLIHFSSKQEYGLYAQLIALQSLYSPLHQGLFVSALLAMAPRMKRARAAVYVASMARGEICLTLVSAIPVSILTYSGARMLGVPVSWATVLAYTAASVGLWWREFLRQVCFADLRYRKALRVDVAYVAITVGTLTVLVIGSAVSTANVFWCMAVGGAASALVPLMYVAFGTVIRRDSMRRAIVTSWHVGKWDTIGSVVTWTYMQSYVYFAAVHGGLAGAAEIAAGRLLATPLMLLWASYSNVLRPNSARAIAAGSAQTVKFLANQSLTFVVGCSTAYGIAVFLLLPATQRTLFAGKFNDLRLSACLWILYAMLAGITTVASSLLRSALKFRQVFTRQVVSSMAALILLTLSLGFSGVHWQILALVIAEVISALLLWYRFLQLPLAGPFHEPEKIHV